MWRAGQRLQAGGFAVLAVLFIAIGAALGPLQGGASGARAAFLVRQLMCRLRQGSARESRFFGPVDAAKATSFLH